MDMLEALRPTATGLDDLPAWFLKVGAPFFAAPIADMFNLSLFTSVVLNQWTAASISPVPKILKPLTPADYRPISITPVLSRVTEPSPLYCLDSWSELSYVIISNRR